MKKGLKKVLSLSLAAISVAGGAVMFAGCETKNPEVEMQLAFNGKTYTLQYKLYRKYAPTTVRHFLKLAEEGYYTNESNPFCIHHYTANKWYTGGYKYDATSNADGGLVYQKYYDIVKGYDEFPFSVWNGDTPTYTLYGEFANNNVNMGQGSFVKQQFGSLAMEYTSKGEKNNVHVLVEKVDGTGKAERKYQYNSATSLFSINLSSSVTTNSSYCTFATLKDAYVETLEELQTAINEYIDANYDEDAADGFADTVEVTVDQDDMFIGEDGQEVEYDVPDKPIYLNYVKVLKF